MASKEEEAAERKRRPGDRRHWREVARDSRRDQGGSCAVAAGAGLLALVAAAAKARGLL